LFCFILSISLTTVSFLSAFFILHSSTSLAISLLSLLLFPHLSNPILTSLPSFVLHFLIFPLAFCSLLTPVSTATSLCP
jgi:hypothetical protein